MTVLNVSGPSRTFPARFTRLVLVFVAYRPGQVLDLKALFQL